MDPLSLGMILGAVTIGASICAWLVDGKTADEGDRQSRMQREYAKAAAAFEALSAAQIAEYRETTRADVGAQMSQLRGISTGLYDLADKLRDALDSDLTPMRRSALRTLQREFQTRGALAHSGSLRLGRDLKLFEQDLREGVLPEPPDLALRLDYPCAGQVIRCNGRELRSGTESCGVVVTAADAPESDAEVPVFITRTAPGKATGSHVLALLSENSLAGLGDAVEAEVVAIEPKGATLTWRGVRLFLPRQEQLDGGRALAVAAEVRVYATDWTWDLNGVKRWNGCAVRVTERREASLRESVFQALPLVVDPEMVEAFISLIEEHADSANAWIFQPGRGWTGGAPTDLLLRNGELCIPVLAECAGSRPHLRVTQLPAVGDTHPSFDPESPFAQFHVPMLVLTPDELAEQPPQVADAFAYLHYFLTHELNEQGRILRQQPGILWFRQWVRLLDGLAAAKRRSEEWVDVVLGAAWEEGGSVGLTIPHAGRLHTFLDQREEANPLLVLSEGETELGLLYLPPDGGDVCQLRPSPGTKASRIALLAQGAAKLQVHARCSPWPEIQQLRALGAFRQGLAVLPSLKTTVLDPAGEGSARAHDAVLIGPDPQILCNPTQHHALREAHAERDFYAIQGPPGSGKSTLIAEIVRQHLLRYPHARVLIVSQSNVAVDGVLRKLLTVVGPEKIVRVGRSAAEDIAEAGYGLEARHKAWVAELRARPLVHFRDVWLAEIGGDDIQADVAEALLARHQVIGATCVGLAQRRIGLTDLEFDLVVVDEAARATPGELMIPLLRARKVILVGDHRQLPPTVDPLLRGEDCALGVSAVDARALHAESLFERVFSRLPAGRRITLDRQFRMAPAIGTLVSRLHYAEEGLQNGPGCGLPLRVLRHPLTWIDTAVLADGSSRPGPDGKSQQNLGEVDVVCELLERLHSCATGPVIEIAVLTPYAAQRAVLDRAVAMLLRDLGVKPRIRVRVATIDAFQGDEAEIVIWCTTRTGGSVRFLNDRHRTNVAASRARAALVVVGSLTYLTGADAGPIRNEFAALAEGMRELGATFHSPRIYQDIRPLFGEAEQRRFSAPESFTTSVSGSGTGTRLNLRGLPR